MPVNQKLMAEVQQLRQQMRAVEDALVSVERTHVVPNQPLKLGRIEAESFFFGSVDPARAYDVDQLTIKDPMDPPIVDVHKPSGFVDLGITKMDRDSRIQNYQQDIAYVLLADRWVQMPVPGRLIPVQVTRDTSSDVDPLFGWEASWPDIIWPGPIGTRAIPPSFEGPLPLLNVNDDGAFYVDMVSGKAKQPFEVDLTVVPAFHVWPLPGSEETPDPLRKTMTDAFVANGATAEEASDAVDKGFYICFYEPPGPKTTEFCSSIVIPPGGGAFHVIVSTDSAGHVTDIEFDSGPC